MQRYYSKILFLPMVSYTCFSSRLEKRFLVCPYLTQNSLEDNTSHDAAKPVFGDSSLVKHKPGCAVTEDG